jgi:hypothetical protein
MVTNWKGEKGVFTRLDNDEGSGPSKCKLWLLNKMQSRWRMAYFCEWGSRRSIGRWY